MSSRGDAERLADIREAIERIGAYIGGMTYEAFLADTKTQDAAIRNIEIVREAAKASIIGPAVIGPLPVGCAVRTFGRDDLASR